MVYTAPIPSYPKNVYFVRLIVGWTEPVCHGSRIGIMSADPFSYDRRINDRKKTMCCARRFSALLHKPRLMHFCAGDH